MLKLINLLMILVLSGLLPFSLSAKEKSVPSPPRPEAHSQDEIPDALDYDRRKAVDHRLELAPYIGDFFGDKLNHSWITGADLTFNFTNMFGLVGNFSWTPASVDRTSALGAIFHQKNLWIFDGGFVINMPAVFRSKKALVECDLYTSIGGGILSINGSSRPGGFIGGGMKIRPNVRWLAIRVDIRDYFTSLENPGGSDFENNLSVRAGPVFLIPPEL